MPDLRGSISVSIWKNESPENASNPMLQERTFQFSKIRNMVMKTTISKLFKLFRILCRPAYWPALLHGVAATVEHENFLRRRAWNTVLDVGSNKGQFSLAVRRMIPGATIEAFEPLTEECAQYTAVFGHNAAAHLHSFALGSSDGEQSIHVSRRRDSSSLLAIGLESSIFPGTYETGTELISVHTLDNFVGRGGLVLSRPVLLKIDTQGYELEVLKGARTSLRDIDDVYVELSFVELYQHQPLAAEVIAWLIQTGFSLQGVYNQTTDASHRPVQADFHFHRE